MGSGIFTRKADELSFHDKIQQSSIDFTRFSIGKRSNRSAKEITIVGIGKVTQSSIILSHRDKQSNTQAHKEQAKKRRTKKRGRIKRQGWSGGEENERQMANNVMRGIRVCDGYLVCLDLMQPPRQRSQKWLVAGRSNLNLTWCKPPRQRCQKSFLLPLEHCVGFPLKRKGWCSEAA